MKDSQGMISIEQIDINNIKKATNRGDGDLPVLTTRDLVLFPDVTFPISLGREASVRVVEQAYSENLLIGIVCQLDPRKEHPVVPDDIYKYGVYAEVIKVIELPDGLKTAIVHATGKFRVLGAGEGLVIPGCPSCKVKPVKDSKPRSNDIEFQELCSLIKRTTASILKKTSDDGAPDPLSFNIEMLSPGAMLINTIATHTPVMASEKIEMLRQSRLKDRGFLLLNVLMRNQERADIAADIREKAKARMISQQRSAFMQAQFETLHDELYGEDDEAKELRRRFEALSLPAEAVKVFEKEFKRFERLNPQSPDYSVLYNYLETLLDLPWNTADEVNTDFTVAEKILDSRHYGLEKVKERILEQLAVMMNTPEKSSPIICLVGAPGVGKTSLGISIAEALGRKFRRISLGGLHDEAEIRGHRRTYIGAMPGRIMTAILKTGTSNPVIMLDEIDKIGNDYKGDPAAALLEVLDPEQNNRFHDNYIDVDFDLSNVMFITTANTLSTISQPLLDRMEIIDISGYLMEEKIEIAKRHFIPKLIADNRMEENPPVFTDAALSALIEGYTMESGVRQLEKELASIFRKLVLRQMRGEESKKIIDADDLQDLSGTVRYTRDRYESSDVPGVVTGLAWTAAGGAILFIESSLAKGKGEKLSLTGNLGDVMKESAAIALQYIRAHADELGIDPEMFETRQLHVHVPEGATPKDGPSAGITMATSIASAFTGRRIVARTAMTGELTLRGKVLPVGGIKEKILAAKRAGIKRIILSADNRKDVEDIKPDYLEGLEFIYVDTVNEVFDHALQPA